MAEQDQVLAWLDSDEPKTVAQLRNAADVLARCPAPRSPQVAQARMRVAVALERLGH